MTLRIKIAKKDYFYNVVENLHKLDEEQEDLVDSWKKTFDENLDRLKRSFDLSFNPCELPYPLSNIQLYLDRQDSCFSAFLLVEPRDVNVFNNLSNRLKEDFSKVKMVFSQTTNYGTGYVMDNSKKIGLSIMDGGSQNPLLRSIGIGCQGAIPRRFYPDREDNLRYFKKTLLELELATTVYINSCYTPFVKGELISLPDTTVYLNP